MPSVKFLYFYSYSHCRRPASSSVAYKVVVGLTTFEEYVAHLEESIPKENLLYACLRVRVEGFGWVWGQVWVMWADLLIYVECVSPSVACQRGRKGAFHIGSNTFSCPARLAEAAPYSLPL